MTRAVSRPAIGLLASLSCVLCAGCYLSHEREERVETECTGPPTGGCIAWEAAGPPTTLTEPLSTVDSVRYGSAIVRDCGVLAAWGIASSHFAEVTVRHETRTVDWSGAPVDPIVRHPAISFASSAATTPILARGPGGAAVLVSGGVGCAFVPLELDGSERGPPVRTELTEGVCSALAATSSGYSFTTQSTGPLTLHSVDADGMPSETTTLAPPRRFVWSRTVFDDGSFLAYSFTEDFVTSRYSSFLQRFDERGLELAPEVELGENGAPVLVSPTARGAIAVWMTVASGGVPLRIRPIDRDGRPAGETRDAPAVSALYGFAIAPTPDGDAVLSWIESRYHETPEWRVQVLALGPDGAPRGGATTVLTDTVITQTSQILVEPSGGRALLLFGDDSGVRAQPLTCVR